MPHTSSQTFLREFLLRSGDIPVAGGKLVATGMSPLPNLAGLAPTQLLGDAGLIDLIATIPFQHADRNSPRRISTHRNLSRHSATTPDGGTIGDIMVFGQDQWAWGAHLRRAQRARRVRLRRKQANQCNPTTWRLAAMNMAKSLPRQSETTTGGLPRHSATPTCGLPRHSATTPGIDFDFGKEPADTFTPDQHPDRSLSWQSAAATDADFVMALPSAAARSLPRSHSADRPNGRINPPFNIKEWRDGKLEGDARWNRSEAELASHAQFYKNRGKYGTPPQTAMRECAPLKSEGTPQVVGEARDKNANFAWVQHMLQNLSRHSATTPGLAPNGSMALLLANGSMSSNSSGEGDIRRALIEADLGEWTVALPGQLFNNFEIQIAA